MSGSLLLMVLVITPSFCQIQNPDCFQQDRKLAKFWLKQHENVVNAKECQEKYCQTNDECTAFVYKTKKKLCVLKKPPKAALSSAELTEAEGLIFGLKYCSGNTAITERTTISTTTSGPTTNSTSTPTLTTEGIIAERTSISTTLIKPTTNTTSTSASTIEDNEVERASISTATSGSTTNTTSAPDPTIEGNEVKHTSISTTTIEPTTNTTSTSVSTIEVNEAERTSISTTTIGPTTNTTSTSALTIEGNEVERASISTATSGSTTNTTSAPDPTTEVNEAKQTSISTTTIEPTTNTTSTSVSTIEGNEAERISISTTTFGPTTNTTSAPAPTTKGNEAERTFISTSKSSTTKKTTPTPASTTEETTATTTQLITSKTTETEPPPEYSLSAAGHICLETGRIPIDDLNDCKAAVTWIQSEYADISSYVDVENLETYPSGCSVFTDVESIYFNTHASGIPHIEHRQICKGKAKVIGNWGTWGNWTTCSEKCGGGIQNRARLCVHPIPKNGGAYCPSNLTLLEKFVNGMQSVNGMQEQSENQQCNEQHCPIVNVTNFSSKEAMEKEGWTFNWNDAYLFSPAGKWCKDAPTTSYCGFEYPGEALLSYTFSYSGTATLQYGQSIDAGSVQIKKNDEVIDSSRNKGSFNKTFSFSAGDELKIMEYESVINIHKLTIIKSDDDPTMSSTEDNKLVPDPQENSNAPVTEQQSNLTGINDTGNVQNIGNASTPKMNIDVEIEKTTVMGIDGKEDKSDGRISDGWQESVSTSTTESNVSKEKMMDNRTTHEEIETHNVTQQRDTEKNETTIAMTETTYPKNEDSTTTQASNTTTTQVNTSITNGTTSATKDGPISVVGPGWCRPDGCDLTSDSCRINAIYKSGSSYQECSTTCLGQMSCVGFSLSDGTHSHPNGCKIYGNIRPQTSLSGWTANPHIYFDVHTSSNESGVMCYRRIACNPNPCNNGGDCSDANAHGTAECTCVGGFSGDTCDIPADQVLVTASCTDTSLRGINYIYSTNYPNDYRYKEDCTWVLKAGAGRLIKLTPVKFDVEGYKGYKCHNYYDSVIVYDLLDGTEKMIGSYCNEENPLKEQILSKGNELKVHFTADNSWTVGKGFKIQYSSPEPVDCKWSLWSDWNDCSTKCIGGKSLRTRTVETPAENRGTPCSLYECTSEIRDEMENCNKQTINCNEEIPCPVKGKWGSWGNWTTCSETCAGGIQNRTRLCDKPIPQYGGANCTSDEHLLYQFNNGTQEQSEIRSCNDQLCPINGNWGSWGNWSACSKTCGGGNLNRTRQCNDQIPQHEGANCTSNDTLLEQFPNGIQEQAENQTCNTQHCPISCEWATWSSWTACSSICEGGDTYRKRTNESIALYEGTPCNHSECTSRELNETENCNKRKKECNEDIPCPGTLKYCLCKNHVGDSCLDSVNATNSKNERTSLHWSARANDSNCTNILVEEGANIEALDNDSKTPLILAAWKNSCGPVKILIANGAKTDALTTENRQNVQACFSDVCMWESWQNMSSCSCNCSSVCGNGKIQQKRTQVKPPVNQWNCTNATRTINCSTNVGCPTATTITEQTTISTTTIEPSTNTTSAPSPTTEDTKSEQTSISTTTSGPTTNITSTSPSGIEEPAEDNTILIASLSSLAACLILGIITAVLVITCLKKRKNEIINDVEDIPLPPMPPIVRPKPPQDSKPITIRKVLGNNIKPPAEEYRQLKELDARMHVLKFSSNISKKYSGNKADKAGNKETKSMNRFRNIAPYDHSLLTLIEPIDECDYVNASSITTAKEPSPDHDVPKHSNSRISFLASQGPLPHTVPHHLQMIVEQKPCVVVMLTKLEETAPNDSAQKKPKCAKYWPSKENTWKAFSHMHVKLAGKSEMIDTSNETFGEIIQRDLEVSNETTDRVYENIGDHSLKHFQYVGWPDHGAPKTTEAIIALAKKVRNIVGAEEENTKVLVHCAAGVGRTGTFIALYQLMECLDEKVAEYNREKMSKVLSDNEFDGITVDIFNTVFNLRKRRCEMVQSPAQYDFLYQCVADYAKEIGHMLADDIDQSTPLLV